MGLKLIENWKHGWKMFSAQATGLGTTIVAAYAGLPSKFQDVIPVNAVIGLAGVCLFLGFVGRFVHQENVPQTLNIPEDKKE